MPEVTVKSLADTVKVPVARLLQQMQEAGLPHNAEADLVSDEQKQQLLVHLKNAHGQTAGAPKRVTVKRRMSGTLRTGKGGRGPAVKVEMRRKAQLCQAPGRSASCSRTQAGGGRERGRTHSRGGSAAPGSRAGTPAGGTTPGCRRGASGPRKPSSSAPGARPRSWPRVRPRKPKRPLVPRQRKPSKTRRRPLRKPPPRRKPLPAPPRVAIVAPPARGRPAAAIVATRRAATTSATVAPAAASFP